MRINLLERVAYNPIIWLAVKKHQSLLN